MPRHRAAILLAAGYWLAAAGPGAAQPHEHAAGSDLLTAETRDLPPHTASVARRLWSDLVCMCGRCPRIKLSECGCPDGKQERDEIVELLRGRDLSTPAAGERAYQSVVAAYVQRFGGRHVLASENEPQSSDWTPWIVLGGLLGLSTVAFILLERQRSRLRPKRRRR